MKWLIVLTAGLSTGIAGAQTPVGPAVAADPLTAVSQTISAEIPLVIAHRGASGYLPEHTTEAAAFAHALGADFIEQDVVLSKDGVAVVLHDITLEAVTNVAEVFPDRGHDGEYFAYDFTLQELERLNVTERYATGSRRRFPRGTGRFQVATLVEHIELIQGMNRSRNRRTGLYVEIKQPAVHREHGLDPSKEVLRILAEHGYKDPSDRVYVQCFDEAEVLRLPTELKCRLQLIQLLSEEPTAEKVAEISKVADGIGVPISAVLRGAAEDGPDLTDLVATAHEHSLMVHVWTFRTDDLPDYADSPTSMLDWLVQNAGIDGIFTDQPDNVLLWRAASEARGGRRGPFHLLQGGKKP